MVSFSIFDFMKPPVEEHAVMQINVVTSLVENPLSDLTNEFPRLVAFDHLDSLSCGDCCNVLPCKVLCLSHSTTLGSCYCYLDGPCLTLTYGRRQYSLNYLEITWK